jgi:hypothetical protein
VGVAELGDRILALHEVPNDALHVGVVADVLGRPAAGDDHGDVVGRVHVREGDVGGPGVPGLLGVGVVAVHEVVHHELELLDRGRGDVDLVSLFEQALVGVHHLEGLGGVTGEDHDLRHGVSRHELWLTLYPSQLRRGVPVNPRAIAGQSSITS